VAVLLKAEKINKTYEGVRALVDIDLEIEDDQILSIIGPNGAGKTTLFNVLTGIDAPTSGKVTFDGRDTTGKPVHTMCRAGLGRTFQNIRLFHAMTVIDNIVVGMHTKLKADLFGVVFRLPYYVKREKEAYKKAEMLLDELGLLDLAYEHSGNLPYGKQRKLEIGRALASEPRMLLLDEPAAGMNESEKVELMDHIRRIRRLCSSIVLIEHNMRIVMDISDRVVVLNFGQMLADCSPNEARQDKRVIEAYLGREEKTNAAGNQ